jgi:hypothetical protein
MEIKQQERIKICHRCKAEFSCYTKDCWCNDLPNIIPFSEVDDCMCPTCLKKEIDSRITQAK